MTADQFNDRHVTNSETFNQEVTGSNSIARVFGDHMLARAAHLLYSAS